MGEVWFEYLIAQNRDLFWIRIRESKLLFDGRSSVSGKQTFASLQVGERRVLRNQRRLWGHWVRVIAFRLEDEELLILVTQSTPLTALADYAKRWAVETLFGIFKSRGYNLEDTHLKNMERLSKLVTLLTLAMIWAIRVGE